MAMWTNIQNTSNSPRPIISKQPMMKLMPWVQPILGKQLVRRLRMRQKRGFLEEGRSQVRLMSFSICVNYLCGRMGRVRDQDSVYQCYCHSYYCCSSCSISPSSCYISKFPTAVSSLPLLILFCLFTLLLLLIFNEFFFPILSKFCPKQFLKCSLSVSMQYSITRHLVSMLGSMSSPAINLLGTFSLYFIGSQRMVFIIRVNQLVGMNYLRCFICGIRVRRIFCSNTFCYDMLLLFPHTAPQPICLS